MTFNEESLRRVKEVLEIWTPELEDKMFDEIKNQALSQDAVNCCLLLEKYIKYVMEAEGSDFIRCGKEWGTDTEFTEQEWNLLTEIATNVNGN